MNISKRSHRSMIRTRLIEAGIIFGLFFLGFIVGWAVRGGQAAQPVSQAPTRSTEGVEELTARPLAVVEPRIVEQPAPEPEILPEPVEQAEPVRVSLGQFKLTHYCPCPKCCGEWADGITYTGTVATEGRTIAVDPKVIPCGSTVVIRYEDGLEAHYIAEDIGGAIKGKRIDVYMDSHKAALREGVKYAEVFVYASDK